MRMVFLMFMFFFKKKLLLLILIWLVQVLLQTCLSNPTDFARVIRMIKSYLLTAT